MDGANLGLPLAAPALRALAGNGIESIGDFAARTRFEIESMHGIGENALAAIDTAMRERGIDFADEGECGDVSRYIEAFSGIELGWLREIRAAIRETIPKAREKMAYGMPTYYYAENLVHFAGFKNHVGFYPTPEGMDLFKEGLRNYQSSKGAIQFPLDRDLPLDLIREMTEFRYRTVLAKLRG